ncbi:hypothetical protein [Roseospira visakhapatnamensis]|uniref:CHASE2 domain-containing sensor protein n=1 Tax=Roseospira visakhapatnamensis TaxID=390880 RepID=A0A7W6W9K6_9PROT|nr:hypothetical protein [Roseospira visakhapatnamensis]MBB4265954.1 CHASE2 domain-containing sensor protein [Roseospira visakhapatnamensis]
MVTLKLILILAVALICLLGYLAVFIFQAWWIIFVALALTALMMVVMVILTSGKVEEDGSAA